MSESSKIPDRRSFLKAVGAGSIASLSGCIGGNLLGGGGETGPLRVGVFGGIFKEMYTKAFFKPYEEQTGNELKIEPIGNVPQILKLKKQVQQGNPPVDVLVQSTEALAKGLANDIYQPFSVNDVPNVKHNYERYRTKQGGNYYGAGVSAWFQAMIINTNKIDQPPTSWKAWWDDRYKNQMEPSSVLADAYFPWLAGMLYFDEGESLLSTKSGIDKAYKKMQGTKPQIKSFYKNEAQGQADMRKGKVGILQMWADVSEVMTRRNKEFKRILPEEGWIGDHGEWTLLKGSEKQQKAFDFMNFTLEPKQQRKLSSMLFTAPAVKNANLSDKLRQVVFGGRKPSGHINFDYKYLYNHQSYMNSQWNKFITGAA
ncbi:MAG: PotD/PotF family extracellular solute-binding protein [Halobacteriaceae archaeon]